MKHLLPLFLSFPLICFAQSRTEKYTETKTKYLELVEITDKLYASSIPTDTTKKYNRIDSIMYSFSILPYPDQLKKYHVKTIIKIIIHEGKDTVVNLVKLVQTDSHNLAFFIPFHLNNIQFEAKVITEYKRKRRKEYKRISETVLSYSTTRIINTRVRYLSCCGGCYMKLHQIDSQLNETRKKYNYSTDELVIRMIPGVN